TWESPLFETDATPPFDDVTGIPQLSTMRTESVAGWDRATLAEGSVSVVGNTERLVGVQPEASRSPGFALGVVPAGATTVRMLTVRAVPSVNCSVIVPRWIVPGGIRAKSG